MMRVFSPVSHHPNPHGGKIEGPTGAGKPGKMRKYFPVREKSGNFDQTGKIRESDPEYWKSMEKMIKLINRKYW